MSASFEGSSISIPLSLIIECRVYLRHYGRMFRLPTAMMS